MTADLSMLVYFQLRMIMGIDIKTHIVHYKKLVDRKQHVIDQMIKFKFSDYTFYEEYDKDELTEEIISEYYVSGIQDPQTWASKVILWGTPALYYHNPQCNPAEISVTIKFGKVMQKLSTLDDEMFLMFDDDIVLCDNFDVKLKEYLAQTPDDWDAIYFGSGANLKPTNIVEGKVAYHKQHPASRCLDSVLLRNKTVKDLAKTWFPFTMISDWEIAHQHYKHNHKVYWWEPSLVIQGSENGLFESAVR